MFRRAIDLFMAILYYLFDKFEVTKNIRWLYFLPLIMMLWVNMHIFFGIGLFMIGTLLLEDYLKNKKLDKKLFVICVISGLATLVNPSGIHGALLPFTIFQNYNFVVEENHSPFKIFSTTSGFVYTRKMEKSPVWRGHSQLSVSPPNFPTLSGGAPTRRIS